MQDFDFAYEQKKSGKTPECYREFFVALSNVTELRLSHLDMLNSISKEWKNDKSIDAQQRLINNLHQRRRRINQTFEQVFGTNVICIKNRRNKEWLLVIREDFLQKLQDRSLKEVDEILKNLSSGKAENSTFAEVTQSQVQYLIPIKDVLKIDWKRKEPKWAPGMRPLARDFDARVICPREGLFNKLKQGVFENELFMLVGDSDTGKTVLALELAYAIYSKNKSKVFFFDCNDTREFDKDRLIKQISQTTGVIVLENIHLEARKIQVVISRIKPRKGRHILLVTRPSWPEFADKIDKRFWHTESLELQPFEQADDIVNHFISEHNDILWPSVHKKKIMNKCKGSLLLLSYALQGYYDAKGQGNFNTWVGKQVEKDLTNLESIELNAG